MRNSWIYVLFIAAALFPRAAEAADRWWDTSPTAGLTTSNDNWSTLSNDKNWSTAATGTTLQTWANVGNAAIFAASGTSAITVIGTVEVNAITFSSSGYTIGGTTLTLTGPSITADVAGTIDAPLGGTVGLTKLGSSSLILGGTNTYTGTTTVSAGTLVLSSGASIASSSTISINSGAVLDVTAAGLSLTGTQTLRGGGTVQGGVTTASGSTIAPGTSPGQLSFSGAGDITLTTGATLEMELGANTTPGVTYDQVIVDHSSSKVFTPGNATLKLIGISGVTTGVAYTIIDATNSASVVAASYFRNVGGAPLDTEGFTYSQSGMSFTIDYDSSFVSVTFSAVPEPASSLFLAGSALLFVQWRRGGRPSTRRG